MNDKEIRLLNAYMEIKAAISYISKFNGADYGGLVGSLDLLKNASINATQANNCKCSDHEIRESRAYWSPPFNFRRLTDTGRVTLIPITFNYCPECGRKL
jgi:hypothetical protein